MKIDVNYRKLASFDDNFASLSRKMDKISDKVNSYARSLDWDVASSENISQNLAKSKKDLQQQSDSLSNMSRFVTKAAKTYKEMDQQEKQSKFDKIKKAISGFLKKVTSGFEKAMGFIGSKFSEYWPKVRDWGKEFFKANWFAKATEIAVTVAGKFFKNSKFINVISGEIFERDYLKNFKLGGFLIKKFDQFDNLIKNSKLVNWFTDPNNVNRLKNSISKVGSSIYSGSKKILKTALRSTPLATVIAIKDITTNSIKIWKNPNLSTEEKWKLTMVEAIYIGGKAVAVTIASAATTLVTWPSGPVAFAAAFSAGLATEAAFTLFEDKLRAKIYDDVDTVFNASKTVYQHRDVLGNIMKATMVPLSPANLIVKQEIVSNTINAIQNHIRPQVIETCQSPIERGYFEQKIGKLEIENVKSLNQLNLASNKIQVGPNMEIVAPKKITINLKTSSYFQAFA